MNVLWVSLVKFPPLCEHLGESVPFLCGWLYSSARSLLQAMPEVKLGVIIYSYGKHFEEYHVDGISYYLVPSSDMSRTNRRQVEGCREAIRRFEPELIHIHGTEHSLAQAVCEANEGRVKTLANIQGLAAPITRYADGGLTLGDKWRNITPLDFYRNTFLLSARRRFARRGHCENAVLRQVTDVVGRTRWDQDHVLSVNPALHYYTLQETLRDSFYEEPTWSLDGCLRHSIFVSNCAEPLKGAHQVLKALPLILREVPDACVSFCGPNVLSTDWKTCIRFQGYHLYLRRLVKRLGLAGHVRFLGALSEPEMKQAFLSAHVYVLPSAIENSSNSLCEAQILGVPAVASYCGGTPSLVKEGETGYLYRYEEHEMLAARVVELFRAEKEQLEALSCRERDVALRRHERAENARQLVHIYRRVLLCEP